MCSSISSFSLFFPSKTHTLLRRRFNFSFSGNPLHIRPRNPSHFPISASIAEKNSGLEFSWVSSDKASDDEYNGWDIVESAPEPVQKKGTYTFSVIGIGASVAAVLGLVAYFSLSSKGFGFRLRSPFDAIRGSSVPQSTITSDIKNDEVSDDEVTEDVHMADETSDDVSDAFVSTETSFNNTKEEKLERIIIPFAVDSAQREALLALKTLEIVEGDVKGDELCTRREYARWLVLSNLLLERRRNHRVNTSAALSGSRITAFNDVGVEDPDFEYIQSLAEAGIVRSKLSDGSNSNEAVEFFPERFICRQDLVNWKAKLEYEVVPGINEEISRKNIGFLDVKEIASNVLVDLFVDIRADEKSIIRGVFGQSKRLQPSKPCTKGQAAVALTSGRTTEFIKDELSRIEAENILRQIEFREVVSELLESGKIKQFWETKIEEERNRGLEVEANYRSAISALEQEKNFQENALAEFVKQKAALDCQEQLLSSLKAEVANLSERICIERNECIDEQCGMKDIKRDLEANFEGLVDAKSILEAEVEALRILRSWIEDEARKSQARAKVLLEAGRRWKWES
ncbi:hypothetical protein ABFS82_05G028500 [Erythranthe guttata]|uniref:uncharacterized protein LOC105974762 n=1 Tax=Erythranthe guttata TaxID=4155 RepID=UPI00064E0E5E|nr:PREDICTED: uncharacterized protein LOC105974762 [Erythranthe guttata]|eukprot:XP_012855364.1 PREDICTED: uncharacterized protein LOC105974762 [Erythranthe guttata]